jgi:hypothetical protein
MLRPWAEAGVECHMFDIQNKLRYHGNMIWHQADLDDPSYARQIVNNLRPQFIASFAPCDDMAVCGSKHFAKKLAADPDCQQRALRRAKLAAEIADELGVPYMVENPVSILATLWRKPDHYFDPCDYGGYLPVDDAHPRFPDIIPPRDAYKKKTCIWSGNGFIMPPKRPVIPISKDNPGWKRLGGKSARTKKIRSETPRGFAIAVKEANIAALQN